MSWISIAASGGMVGVAVLLLTRPLAGLTALILFYPFNEFVPRGPLPGLNSETVLLSLAAMSTLFRKRTLLAPFRFSAPVLAYVVVILFGVGVTASWYTDTYARVTNLGNLMGAKSLLFPTLVFFIAYLWSDTDTARRRLLHALCYAVLVVALSGIVDWLLHPRERATGLFDNPNTLGVLLAMCSVVPAYVLHRGGSSPVGRGLLIATWALAVVAVVPTLSRQAWLACLVAMGAWLGFMNRRLLVAAAAGLLLCATVAYPLVPTMVRERIAYTFSPGQRIYQAGVSRQLDASTGQRVVLYRVGLRMFLDSPVWGHGFNSVLLLTPSYGASYGLLEHREAHSIPLKVTAESGLLGLGVFLWMVIVLAGSGWRLWRVGGPERALGIAFLAACAAFGVSSLAGTTIREHPVALYFWILFGIAARAEWDRTRGVADRQAAGMDPPGGGPGDGAPGGPQTPPSPGG